MDVDQGNPMTSADQTDGNESLRTVKGAVGLLEDAVKAAQRKYLDKIKSLESTVAQLRSEAETLISTNERLTKAVEAGKVVEDGLRKEVEECGGEVTRLRVQVGQLEETNVGGSNDPQSPLTALQAKYDTLHKTFLRLNERRDQDRSEVRRIFDAQTNKLKAYGSQIRALGGVPGSASSGGIGLRGRKRRIDGDVERQYVGDKMGIAGSRSTDLNMHVKAESNPSSPTRPTLLNTNPNPTSTSTPSKPPPKDVRECFTVSVNVRRPLEEVRNDSRENTPSRNKSLVVEYEHRSGNVSEKRTRKRQKDPDLETPRSEKTKRQKMGSRPIPIPIPIEQPVFVRETERVTGRYTEMETETDLEMDLGMEKCAQKQKQKQKPNVRETESNWMIRGLEGTMQRQAEQADQAEQVGDVDVFGSRGIVLVEESQELHPAPAAAVPRPRRILVRPHIQTHTPLHTKPSYVRAPTSAPAALPAITRTTDRWLGGHKTRRRELRRKDSFEDEWAGGGGVGGSGTRGTVGGHGGGTGIGSTSSKAFDSIGVVRKEIEMREVVLGPGNIPSDMREDQGMPDDDDSIRYEINPDRNGGVGYAYGEVVRNKEHRKHLKGEDCDECRRYYDDTADIPIVDNAPVWRTQRGSESKRQKNVDQVSRHRSKHHRNLTPPGYWQTAFPATQQVDQWNEQAERMKADKKERMRLEAEKPDGMYRAVR